MDFDKILYDGGLKRLGTLKKVQRGIEIYTIANYSDLDELLGPQWFIRGFNQNGDFCYAIMGTEHYHLRTRRQLTEFKPSNDGSGTIKKIS